MESKGLELSTETFAKPKVQPLNLLKGVASIIKDAMTAGWANMPADIIDTISAIKLNDTPNMIGWKLISRSLADALVTLISETNPIFYKEDIELEPLDKTLNEYLENTEYFLDGDFFKKPKSFALINDVKPTLKEYLIIFDFGDIEASNILRRLNSYFVFSLINEWRKNVKYYAQLKEVLETPFDSAEKKESEWNIYGNYLETQIEKPIFSETFSLSQIYIPLRSYYKTRIRRKGKQEESLEDIIHKDNEAKRIVVDTESYLIDWINNEDKNDSIRIIRGGPGYGKSSFLKMFASKLSLLGKKVLFIPLHRFDIDDKLDFSIYSFLRYDKYFTHDPINESDEKLIILFDGLDELSMQGKALSDVAQSFLREVERSVNNYNSRKLRIQTIITGRDVIIQQNEKDFRNDGQILRLLPYYIPESQRGELVDSQNLLGIDQRQEWWRKYGDVTGRDYEGTPKELLSRELDEITSQPLLNFLVALSFERKKVDFTEATNLNEIYGDLLNAVYERSYSDGKRLKAICEMEHDHFCIMLEEIALSAWHGTGRTTTVREIKKHFENSGLIQLLNHFISDAEKGVVSLLAAFYFRQAGQMVDGMQTFEFTHKSFGEYLTAKKIVRQLLFIHDQLEKNEKDILKREGWSYEKCLTDWVKLFAGKELDFDLTRFIKNELILIYKENDKMLYDLQKTVVKLIEVMLVSGMPLEKLHPRLETFKQENEFAINSEKGLIVIHGIIASLTDIVSQIKWPKPTSFGELIARTCGQRHGPRIFILKFLNHIDARGCILHIKDLYGANLRSSILIDADLSLANMEEANLTDVDLSGSMCWGASMRSARLVNVKLADATLERVDFFRARLEGVVLNGTNMRNSNFMKAELYESDFKNVDVDLDKARGLSPAIKSIIRK